MNSNSVRVRFAPSPTGIMHIGNARTALFNYLFAKSMNGSFILRIEDTDQERSKSEYELVILKALYWLGIQPDEGVVGENFFRGEYGPYRQSERLSIYHDAILKLKGEGKIYPCFCSQDELDSVRNEQLKNQKPLIYNQKCKNLSKIEQNILIEQNKPFVFRFSTPKEVLIINDLVRGRVEIDLAHLGDFIITRPDGSPTFHLAVSVDDGMMKISHVIRGEDHLSNTPKHILLMKALGFSIPQYAHLSMILGPDRQKLSKRHGSTSVEEFQSQGYLSDALFNYLSLLGWNPKNDQEVMSRQEICQKFKLENVNKSAAIFDYTKFRWIGDQHLQLLSDEEFFEWANPFLMSHYPIKNQSREYCLRLIKLVREGVSCWSDIPEKIDFLFEEEFSIDETIGNLLLGFDGVQVLLEEFKNVFQSKWKDTTWFEFGWIQEVGKLTGIKGKNLFMPLRIATTGQEHGRDLTGILNILGREKVVLRLQLAVEWLEKKKLI